MLHFSPGRFLTFSWIKTKALLKGLGRCGQPCMTHASPAVDGAAPAPPTCYSGVQGRGGRCHGGDRLGHVLGHAQFWPAWQKTTTSADLAVDFYVPARWALEREGKIYLIVWECRLFYHGFTHVDSHIEELQIKGDLSPSPPSPFPSTSGLEQGAPLAVSSVSDFDILVTKASPHNRK